MTAGQWQRVQEILDAALDLPADERPPFLDRACEGDPAIRDRVDRLIDSHERAGSIFEAAVQVGARNALLADSPASGDRIGPYQLTGVIGEGGMGTVYRATRADDQFQQQVAIKVVRAAFANTAEALARFRSERQILASFNHPNICRLLDGGVTASGLPYLAMEFVDGVAIDRYCGEKRLLARERLGLFRQVCSAVQYAHQNLIVHRDIKPANILVTPEGVPKLLDFGIAKLLTADSEAEAFTRAGNRPMTPEYASPEQIRGEPITTAADVYALGVLLYELLTGRPPFRVHGLNPADAEKLICDTVPEKPSSAAASETGKGAAASVEIKSDLDNIVLMAIRKEPSRRYASASELSEDVRRYVDGFPVRARKSTWSYRSGRFVRRHWFGTAAAAIMVTLLAGGIVTTRVAQLKAQRHFKEVREMATTFLFDFDGSIASLPGATQARKLVVTRALDYLDRLAREAAGDSSLQEELASAYEKVSEIQYKVGFSSLGDSSGSLESVRKAIAIREAVARAHPDGIREREELANAYTSAADTLQYTRELAGAAGYSRKAIQVLEDCLRQSRNDRNVQDSLAETYRVFGQLCQTRGDNAQALDSLNRSLRLREELARNVGSPVYRSQLAVVLVNAGDLYDINLGDAQAGLQRFQRALEIWTEVAAGDPNNSTNLHNVAVGYGRSGRALLHLGNVAAARQRYEKWVAADERLAKADPSDLTAQRGLSMAYRNLAETIERMGDLNAADAVYRKTLAIRAELFHRNPKSSEARDDLAYGYMAMGELLTRKHDMEQSIQDLRKSITLREPLVAGVPDNTEYSSRMAETYMALGDAYLAGHNCGGALPALHRALDIYADLSRRGKLHGLDKDRPQRISRHVSECERAPLRGPQ